MSARPRDTDEREKCEKPTWERCINPNCDGEIKYVDDDYGSLGDGGSYEIWDCQKCGKRRRFALPD